jgi:fructoselysine-6-P-deglycase FrlB-like protein
MTDPATSLSLTEREIQTQPDCWERAIELAQRVDLVRGGARMAVLGCGSSWFTAMAVAALREAAGHGETDAFTPSEAPLDRHYDVVVAISRSGTTTEVVRALEELGGSVPTLGIVAVAGTPVAEACDEVLVLDFADEESVVQTRFPTTALLLARAAFGEDVSDLPAQVETAIAEPLDIDVTALDHFVYLGTGWTRGLADEAALKIREAAQAWAESYPLFDFRHGPLAVAGERSIVWLIGRGDDDLVADIRATGATVRTSTRDPLVELVQAQRLALAVAEQRGLDPDAPRALSRSIILS